MWKKKKRRRILSKINNWQIINFFKKGVGTMRQDTAKGRQSSRVSYETLEGFVREKAQGFIQDILEEEVSVFLGREKSERFSSKE